LELPSSPWGNGKARPPFDANWKKIPGVIAHTFSHFDLELRLLTASVACAPKGVHGFWMKKRRLLGAGFPSVMKKAIRRALAA
ncbi:MAG TPA: A/G-specific adenine glycosylase, partial [Sphingomonadales bacterium]|nr:A/G-specific adenine glycosylase [Sphingomonadales bacterium]